jgi:hypothetical protein
LITVRAFIDHGKLQNEAKSYRSGQFFLVIPSTIKQGGGIEALKLFTMGFQI